jgi:hypothetical protein
MAFGCAEIYETAFGYEQDPAAISEYVLICLVANL